MNKMERLTVDLTADDAAYVDRLVASGEYASPSEVVQAGLDALQGHDAEIEHWLRTEVVETYDRIQRGEEELIPIEKVIEHFQRHRAERDAAE